MKKIIILGFSSTSEVETRPGVWSKQTREKRHRADVLSYNRNFDSGTNVNEDVTLRNRYSIVMKKNEADQYTEIKYIGVDGIKWKVTAIEFLPPRLILTVGGLYNGD